MPAFAIRCSGLPYHTDSTLGSSLQQIELKVGDSWIVHASPKPGLNLSVLALIPGIIGDLLP